MSGPTMLAWDNPAAISERLCEIENDLAVRQGDIERAARDWFVAKRDREKQWAEAFIAASGTVDKRKAVATEQTADVGKEEEAAYEAVKAVLRVLETRASIGQSLLRSQGRVA